MEKKRTVQRKHGKKKRKPVIRFNFGMMLLIFVLSFGGCFILYMLAANVNPNFLEDEFGESSVKVADVPVKEPAIVDSEDTEPTENVSDGITNPVPASAAADPSYLGSCCLITDSTLIKMDAEGGFSKANIFGSDQLGAANCMTIKVDSNFGNDNVYEIAKSKKPEIMYIMLGSDLSGSSQDDMIGGYTTLVTNLHAAMPTMKIFVMQYPPVIYDSDKLTNDAVNSYNKKLLAMADAAGVYCIDTNTALKGENGALAEKYWSYDELCLSADGYKAVMDYILEHTV